MEIALYVSLLLLVAGSIEGESPVTVDLAKQT